MAYIASNDIKMFPSSNRNPENDATSRLTTEYNLVNIVNRLITDNIDGTKPAGFVITETADSNSPFEFSIHGYYFYIPQLSSLTDSFTSETNIWGSIKMSSDTSNAGLFEYITKFDPNEASGAYTLDGTNRVSELDGTNEFLGVKFTDDKQTDPGVYSVHLLTKSGNNWVIPEDSKIRFRLKSPMNNIVTLKIDDGQL